MRELVSLSDEKQARLFTAYLFAQNIPATVDDDDGEWVIWIHNDDDRGQASELLAEFQREPDNTRYENADRKVRHVLKEADRLQHERKKTQHKLNQRWQGAWWYCYPATYIILAICILVAVICTNWRKLEPAGFGFVQFCNDEDSVLLRQLRMLDRKTEFDDQKRYLGRCRQWEEEDLGRPIEGNVVDPTYVPYLTRTGFRIRSSAESFVPLMKSLEYWRLVTPAVIHLSLLHLLMNMSALVVLGKWIEYVRGTRRFVCLCLILAVTSNLVQFFWAGPGFGGFSGVLLGLVGYAWMKGVTQPQQGIALRHEAVMFCFIWQAVCISGLLGPIANAAHTGGFIFGILIGARRAIWKKLPFTS